MRSIELNKVGMLLQLLMNLLIVSPNLPLLKFIKHKYNK